VVGGCLLGLMGGLAGVGALAAEPAPGPLPVEMFFRHPDITEVRPSPSGRLLAMTVRREQRLALAVIDLEGQRPPTVVAGYRDADIDRFEWVNDNRLAYSVTDRLQGGADQTFWFGLFAVDADGGGLRHLIKLRNDLITDRTKPGREPLDWFHHLLMVPSQHQGDDVIVGKDVVSALKELVEVVPMRLNTVTGQVRSLGYGMPQYARYWLFDSQGEPRVATTVHEGQVGVHWRAPGANEWKLLATMPELDRAWFAHSVDDKGGLYVTVKQGEDGVRVLKRFDFATGQPATDDIAKTPGFDFLGRLVRDQAGAVLGVRLQTDAETTVWFDQRLVNWQGEVDKALPGRVNRLTCRRCSSGDPLLLVFSWFDRHPGELLTYEPARGAKAWTRVGTARKDVDERRMATLDFFRVRTRDGLDMPVWLTLPLTNGRPTTDKTKTPRPAVLLVHGGPWVRGGHWAWDGEAQFLASRGYVVIEPEFRGSTGYGDRHFRAGFKQWGQAMEDDLADALQWAVAAGHVDKSRVCIAGGNYGGYAALMGPVRYPGMFKCVAAWMAFTDLNLLYGLTGWSSISEESQVYRLPILLGDPKADVEMLKANSPLYLADRIKVPVMLTVGGADRYVPLPHGRRMADALEEAGNPPVWQNYPDEGHGWYKADNRIDFARKLEAFLAQHLK
jgi:acetyl esterase/lipase